MQQTAISEMGLVKTTLWLEDPCENQSSEMELDTKLELPKAELLIHKPSMEHKFIQEEQSSQEDDFPDPMFEHSCSMAIFYNDELDYLEVQKLNNIMKAAYKEFMAIASEANAWVLHTPVVGSIEDLQEMFHTPPPHGCTVKRSVKGALFPISSHFLISIMMNSEQWASLFFNIICEASHEEVLAPLKKIWRSDKDTVTSDVILVHAQFRLPAEYLPRWSTSFLRFKRLVDYSTDTWAIFDVSTDYFKDATFDHTEKIDYMRRPSGVIIRPLRPGLSEVIWVENAVVQEINIPKNMCSTFNSNFPFNAEHWLNMLSHNLNRNRSSKTLLNSAIFNKPIDVVNLLTIAKNLRRVYIQTVNPFPMERVWDLVSDDEIRILKDTKPHINDYIAISTIYIPDTPERLATFLDENYVELQWPSTDYPIQAKFAAGLFSEDGCNIITLRAKKSRVFQGHEYLINETSLNEYCSFVLSSPMSEADVRFTLSLGFCRACSFLRPTGFAIMPAGPGGLMSKASYVTICVRLKLECMEADQVIETMRSYMDAMIYQITPFPSPNTNNEDSKQNTLC